MNKYLGPDRAYMLPIGIPAPVKMFGDGYIGGVGCWLVAADENGLERGTRSSYPTTRRGAKNCCEIGQIIIKTSSS